MTAEITDNNEEKIETIGAFLKQARLKKNISLSKVSEDLCIRKVYIKAIEENDHKELPPVPYGTGFVRSYAKYLGLNVERIVQLYKDETIGDEKKLEIFEVQDEITYPSKQYIIGGVITALVVYLLYAIVSGVLSGKEQVPIVVVEEETNIQDEAEAETLLKDAAKIIAEQEAKTQAIINEEEMLSESILVKEPEPEPETEVVEEPAKTESNARVVVKIKDETWMQVKGAVKTYMAQTVDKGFEYELPEEKGVVLTIGRPYNADVYIDGELKVFTTERNPIHINVDEYLNNNNH